MDIPVHAARHVRNKRADSARPYSAIERRILNREAFAVAHGEISAWPEYEATPLLRLDGLAERLGLGSIHYKDEGRRFGLASFKALGGAYAVLRILQAHLADCGHAGIGSPELIAGPHRDLTAQVTVTSATDGNHGRSVAWGAQMFGCRCIIYLHAHVSDTREAEIARFGAEIVRVDGNYDDSVRQCAQDAVANGRTLVADTNAGGGDASVPSLVMQGYTILAEEFLVQSAGRLITHVFVPGGVGGIAAAIAGHLWETLGRDRPRIVVVEPGRADCVFRSIAAGAPTPVPGDFETFMACLAAGQVSPLAWPLLEFGIDDVLTIPDEAAADTMRLLAQGVDGDVPVVSGESGCASTAGLIAAMHDGALAADLGLGADAQVIVIGSEGATDTDIYRRVVGCDPEDVERRAA